MPPNSLTARSTIAFDLRLIANLDAVSGRLAALLYRLGGDFAGKIEVGRGHKNIGAFGGEAQRDCAAEVAGCAR